MLMFNNLIDGEWLSDGARAPNVNPSDTKDIVGEAVEQRRFPDIWPADDRNGEAHGGHVGWVEC